MDPIYTFGFKLAQLMNQKEFAGVGLLCLAIKDSGKTYTHLTYDDFKQVILLYLPKRLENVKATDRSLIIAEMLNTLSQNQSIFTLSSR
jgi:hypothetical protein